MDKIEQDWNVLQSLDLYFKKDFMRYGVIDNVHYLVIDYVEDYDPTDILNAVKSAITEFGTKFLVELDDWYSEPNLVLKELRKKYFRKDIMHIISFEGNHILLIDYDKEYDPTEIQRAFSSFPNFRIVVDDMYLVSDPELKKVLEQYFNKENMTLIKRGNKWFLYIRYRAGYDPTELQQAFSSFPEVEINLKLIDPELIEH